jgi:hypothetical protein
MSETIRAEDAFYSASGDAKVSHVDVRDIAAVAVQALTGASHEGKAYTLTGPEAFSYDEIASVGDFGTDLNGTNLSGCLDGQARCHAASERCQSPMGALKFVPFGTDLIN